jgi:hypothetical protein
MAMAHENYCPTLPELTLRIVKFFQLLFLALCGTACEEKDPGENSAPALSQASGADIEALTGGPTRIVWTRDTDPAPKNPWQYGDSQQLLVFDSNDPTGVHVRLSEVRSYGKPLLSPDGEKIVFSDRSEHEIFALDFTTGEPEKIADGFALEIWRDPADGRQWIYAGTGDPGTRITSQVKSLFRFPLDAPSEVEILFEELEVAVDNFQLSRDGGAAAGLFPWPHGGLMRITDGKWARVRSGCWASMSPDNSYVFWVFDGGHHVPSFFDPVNEESWEVSFDTAPEFAGAEVYHPRWSNRADLITLSGPYPKGVFTDLASGEIMLGKLSPDLRKVERWVQITDDNWPDGYADVWVAGGDTVNSDLTGRDPADLAKSISASGQWEKDRGGYVFRWSHHSSGNRIYDSVSGEQISCFVSPSGHSIFGRAHSMRFNGDGAFATDEGFESLIQHFCRIHKSFGLEVMLTAESESKGQIVCYGPTSEQANFGLAQEGLDLVFSFQLSALDANSAITRKVGRLHPGRTHHFYVKFGNGVVASYLDGELTHAEEFGGNLDEWQPGPLLFGNSPSGERPWKGTLWLVHAHDNPDLEYDIAEHASAQIAEHSALEMADTLKVRARLVETTPVPPADSIGAYRRALIGNVYEVTEVLEGALEQERIAVFHWAILDRMKVTGAERKTGENYTLTLEPMASRPELKGERRFFDSDAFDLELFLDTSFP